MISDNDKRMPVWLRRPTLLFANGMYLLTAAWIFTLGVVVGILYNAGIDVPNWFLMGLSPLAMALPPVLYATKRPGVSLSMRLNPPSLHAMLWALLSAVAAAFAMPYLNIFWVLLIEAMGGTPVSSGIPTPTDGGQLLTLVFLVGVLPGVCEELLFRGAILGAWERRGAKYALAVSSILFCMMHGQVGGIPTQLILGFALGYIVISSNSLYVGMVFHTMFNASALVMIYLAQFVEAPPGEIAEAAQSMYDSLGGAAGVMQAAFATLLFGAIFAATLLPFRRERVRDRRPFETIDAPDRAKMGWRELAVLLIALLTVGVFYYLNAAEIFGWPPFR